MTRHTAADFRYNTGPARIPWTAVGETVKKEDILRLIEFLVPHRKETAAEYRRHLNTVGKEIEKLWSLGGPVGKLSLGKRVAALEDAVKRFLKCRYACFLTNATAGFEIACKFAGLKPGDEVIAPAITFIATIVYPLEVGAKVVLADVDLRTLNMDPADVARKITPRTKVIIPVHMGGYPVDMDPLMKLAEAQDITVIEDAAHAFGAVYKGRMAGTIGHFGAFSFHEVKNITALGEGGVLVTNTPFGEHFGKARFVGLDTARQIPTWLYDVTALPGKGGLFTAGNHSSTEIQAVCLLSQMARMKKIIVARRRAAEYLNKRFAKVPGLVPPPLDSADVKSTHHLYLLQVDTYKAGGDVQKLKEKLAARGVTNIPHFAPLYKFEIMRQLGYDIAAIQASCPNAEKVFSHRFTHLPLYDFTKAELKLLADLVIDAAEEMSRSA